MQDRLIILFTKPLEPGKVKKRLANRIGESMAFEIYLKLFNKTIEKIKRSGIPFQIYISEPSVTLSNLSPKLQRGRDLGERMSNAIDEELHQHREVCLIGGDCLDISDTDLSNAFNGLAKNDLVIGPSRDGGYYLIGMKNHNPELFKSIHWSTSTVYHDTIRIATQMKLAIHRLPERQDVDYVEDIPGDWLQKLKK